MNLKRERLDSLGATPAEAAEAAGAPAAHAPLAMRSPSLPDTSGWVVRPVALKISLGERRLFWFPFTMAVKEAHFTELADDEYVNWSDWSAVPGHVDAVVIRSQPVTSPLPRRLATAGGVRYVPAQYLRYYMEFNGTFEQYLQKFSSKVRSNRKREVKKFAEFSGGTIDFRQYRTAAEVEEFYRLARELSRKTFQERLLDAGLPDNETYRSNLLDLASQDRIRAYLMFKSGAAVAYLLTEVRVPDILLYRYLGYDPEFRSWSPGTVLHCLAFERLFAEQRFRFLDFTEGEGTHKKFFATGNRSCADIFFFRRTFKNRMFLLLHSSTEGFSRAVAGMLDRLGLKARIKKLLRAWA